MNSAKIRQTFLDFFSSKGHSIVPSAPIVVKNDPTLMFTNAGMNQFKDYFLGNKESESPRISDTQKCLRVSGKHNDLEEVGRDSYHHTMFEMLGNWSFGDYFKEEAIAYAWELLTDVYKIDPEKLYVTVFGGDKIDKTGEDDEAAAIWAKYVPKERILYFDKKDNFWEMGDTGPCGPCSEIHVDLRSDEEKKAKPGAELVNEDDPMVIEIWNLVFIQYNRKADGSLENLPQKHVDTGMGFERLAMILQGKTSNYESDIFTPYIETLVKKTGIEYTNDYTGDSMTDIAMRVITDHIRAVAFTIADGEMPSNTGAGYVVRRILRRAVRYYYSFLNINEPFIYTLIPMLADQFEEIFPELKAQEEFISKVILEEEKSFLRTLADGLKRLDALKIDDGTLSGLDAFELYDTYGFPFDLTRLVAEEKGWNVDEEGFNVALEEQRDRSRADAEKEAGDWIVINDGSLTDFLGYDHLQVEGIRALKHRTISEKGTKFYQLITDKTPFYPEGGGQVGDVGSFTFGDEEIKVLDTTRENDIIIHYIDKIPTNISSEASARVASKRRKLTENNHSSTHLMHAALREVLGSHVQQKGSLVKDDLLRFDFSHFEKMSVEEIEQVETIVNQKIRENIKLGEDRDIPKEDAKAAGAMMLFGEKYGDSVRMITFDEDFSVELCGGCHVDSTGQIGQFKITSESGIAAGVRRITAITAEAADKFIKDELNELEAVRKLFKNPNNVLKQVSDLLSDNKDLQKELDKLKNAQAGNLKGDIIAKAQDKGAYKFITEKLSISDSKAAKTLIYNIEKEVGDAIILFGLESNGKAQLMLLISKALVESQELDAGSLIREIAQHINGRGGGQAFFATAGGANPSGIDNALAAFLEKFD